jgi:hypothetical protein
MHSMTQATVRIQTSSESVSAVPSWFGEGTVIAHFLKCQGALSAIEERVRFARRRFGHYDLIDFVVVLLGYAISGERTLEAFYEGLQPFADPFMALFGRERLPHRSTLSRFLAATLIKLRLRHCARCFSKTCSPDLWKRRRKRVGCGIDRETIGWCSMSMAQGPPARGHALPSTPDLPRYSADWTRSVLQAISGASGVKPSGLGPLCSRHIRTNGSARFPVHTRIPSLSNWPRMRSAPQSRLFLAISLINAIVSAATFGLADMAFDLYRQNMG